MKRLDECLPLFRELVREYPQDFQINMGLKKAEDAKMRVQNAIGAVQLTSFKEHR